MKIIILLTAVTIISCSYSKKENTGNTSDSLTKTYEIIDIDSLNNWNIVYAQNQDQKFKIVIQKQESVQCDKILIGNQYELILRSQSENAPVINGVKLYAENADCYYFDDDTPICKEKDIGIFDLHFTEQIKGLCYIGL